MFFLFFFFLLASLCSLVSALPLASLVVRDVWVPRIICPDANTVWSAGGNYTVTWDVSSKPSQVTNPVGAVYLRIGGATQSSPLVQGFPLTNGQVTVTVPTNTTPSDEWIVVLFGDSGNFSPSFTIHAPSS